MKNIRDDFLKSHKKLHGSLYYELENVAHLQQASDTIFFGVPCHVYELKSDPTCKVYFGINNQWHFNKPYMLKNAIRVMHWYQRASKIAQGFDKAHQSGTYNYASAFINMRNNLAARLNNNWKREEKKEQDNKFINVNHLRIKNGTIWLHTLAEFSYSKIFKHNIIPRLIYDHVFNTPDHVLGYRWIKLSDVLNGHTKHHIKLPYESAKYRGHDYRMDTHQISLGLSPSYLPNKYVKDTPKNNINRPKCFIVNDTLKSKLMDYIKQQVEYVLLLNSKQDINLPVLIKD